METFLDSVQLAGQKALASATQSVDHSNGADTEDRMLFVKKWS